jgi:ABC-type branched-subunit amino acid transport system ATPase component/ABC-type branched-subunit amino acid transport system permease subunit
VIAAIVLGVVTGLTIGALAIGLVLVYKASRFANLAHGQLGATSAVILATLVLDHGWSWWAAFPVALALGIGLGFLAERLIIRRFRRQQRRGITMLLVAIGIGQLLLAVSYIPAFAPDRTKLFRSQYPLPFDLHWRVGGADLTGSHLMILVLIPTIVAGLAAFLRWSSLGKSIRAVASNPESARLCGISVDRVNAITWGIAGGLSALTAILLAPGQSLFDSAALGPALLLRALGAAALGGFTSLPAALVGGLASGIVEHVTLSVTSQGSTAELAVFITVLVILFARGRALSAAAEDAGDVTEDQPPVRIPDAIRDRFVVRSHRGLLGCVALVPALVLPHLPHFREDSNTFLLVIILVFAVVGVGLTMLVGWAGQVSLGHFAVVGMGAYLAAKLGERDMSLPAVLLVAGLLGAATLALVGLPGLRLRGLTLAVTTLGFAVVAPAWLFTQSWFGAEGQSVVTVPALGLAGVGRLDSQRTTYYAALALLVLTVVLAGGLRRSVPGRLILAARDNDRALTSFGVTPTGVKLATLGVSGFLAGMAGVIWGVAWNNVSADLVQPSQSLALLAIPVVGGLGSIAGAVAAAFVIYVPTFFVAPHLTPILGDFGSSQGFQLAVAGAGLVLIPLQAPTGLAGQARRLWEKLLARTSDAVTRWAPTDDAEALEVEGITVRFGGIRALDEVDLTVHRGEIVGLIGPNGAGKTTLINVISGHLPLAAGRVRLSGHDVGDLAPELRSGYGLGRSFQDARLFPGLTVREAMQVALVRSNRVGFVSSMLHAPWARDAERASARQADELLEAMGMAQWADSLVSGLSTGMRRITDLTMQVAARPGVLLLDEPTAGVAQRETEAFGPMLRKIRDELDCAIVIVEHDMPLLMGLCDRIYAMETGRIIAEGTPEEIRRDPLVIASYLGSDERAIARSNGRAAPAPTPSVPAGDALDPDLEPTRASGGTS